MAELSKAERQEIRDKKRQRTRLIRRIKVGAILCAVLAVILYLLSAFVFFKIENVLVTGITGENGEELSGSSYYSAEEIVRISGVDIGDSLVLVSKSNVKESIEKLLPYIGNVKVQRRYPSTLKLTVEDTSAVYAFDAGGGLTLMNEDYKVLEVTQKLKSGSIKVVGVPIKTAETGTISEFADEAYKSRLDTVKKACEKAEINDVTKIDLTNIANVRVTVDGRYTFILGTLTQLDEKISMALQTMASELSNNPSARIIIDVTDPGRSYVRDDYSPIEIYEEESSLSYTEEPENNNDKPEDVPEEIPEEVPEAVG